MTAENPFLSTNKFNNELEYNEEMVNRPVQATVAPTNTLMPRRLFTSNINSTISTVDESVDQNQHEYENIDNYRAESPVYENVNSNSQANNSNESNERKKDLKHKLFQTLRPKKMLNTLKKSFKGEKYASNQAFHNTSNVTFNPYEIPRKVSKDKSIPKDTSGIENPVLNLDTIDIKIEKLDEFDDNEEHQYETIKTLQNTQLNVNVTSLRERNIDNVDISHNKELEGSLRQQLLRNISPLSRRSTPPPVEVADISPMSRSPTPPPPPADGGVAQQVPLLRRSSPAPREAVGAFGPEHRFDILPVQPRVAVAAPRRGRGGGKIVGRGRGRIERSDWRHGEPYRERFVTDEELPEPVRMAISQQRVCDRRNVEEEDVEMDEEDRELLRPQEFVWEGMSTWEGRKETFRTETTGPTRAVTSPYDAFRCYWDEAIVSHIATESNRYAQSIQRARFQSEWYETNEDEILLLFCFWIMLGVIHMPTVKSCFSSSPLLKTEIFRKMFCQSRYWNLNAAFHLNDSANGDGSDPIHPIRPVVDHMNAKFKEFYALEQNISIDESLTLWKGPLAFKQYIKTKAARLGVKTYQLCESSTGYLWSFFVYVGPRTSNSPLASNVSTVMRLIRPLLNRGHVLFMDDFFNSPSLARHLKHNGTDCVGTLRANRKQVPIAVQECPLGKGEFIARHAGDVMTVAIQGRKRTTCISTYHDVSQVQKMARPGHPAQHKLALVDEYNHNIGGVRLMDQKLESYLVERKQCTEWSKKMLKRILNITVQNSRILLEKSSNRRIDSLAFRLELVSEIMERHLSNVPRAVRESIRRNPAPAPVHRRLTERHFISRIEVTQEMRDKVVHRSNLGRRICVVCRKKSVYECRSCEAALCLVGCFETYHTVP